MREQSDIVKLFEALNDANKKSGDAFQVARLNPMLSELQSGAFFFLPAAEQVFRLGNQCEAYVGKGEIIRSLIDKNLLGKDFGEKMQITVWRHFLTLDISEDQKIIFREHLAQRLKL